MHSMFDLTSVTDALVRIRDAGWLLDLETAIAEATRGPSRDLDRWPCHRATVEEMTRLTMRVTGLPDWICRDAAIQRLLPSTKRRIALGIIREFEARLDHQSQADALAAKLARERAGRRSA